VVTSAHDALVGQTVDGRYQVLAHLARGGMATVYQALDLRLDRVVALKVMHRHLAEDPDFVARFQREAKSAARLTHPHVVGVYDQGAADGLIYLVMEYVPSRTLRDVLRQFGPLSAEQALVILDPVLEGLSAAHAAGFVHRDIKPENVLISDDGRVKVADFGLARAVSSTNTSATQGMIIGTVAYLSPEQVERGEADGRSDVYAAGILLFEMVTGEVPHAGDSPLSVAYKHVNNDVPPPSTIQTALPSDLDALVVTATRRDPSLRYQSAVDFLADVRRVRSVLPTPRPFADSRDTLVVDASTTARLNAGAPRPAKQPTGADANPPASIASMPIDDEQPRPRRRRRGLIVTLVIALVVIAAGVGGWYVAAGPGRSIPTPSIVGLDQTRAEQLLAKSGLSLEVTEQQFSEDIAADLIITSDPAPGADVREGGAVSAIVSRGPERYSVPDVRGQTAAEATASITGANLAVGTTEEVFDDVTPVGTVAATDPKIGASLKPATIVNLFVSKGPKPVDIPNLVGRKSAVAKKTLATLGLSSAITSKFSETVVKGDVISMSPKAGTTVNSGSEVTLVTSKGPPPVTVPNLIDSQKGKAVSELKRLGLKVNVLEGEATPLNRVYSQDPSPGTQIPKGSTVTIRVI
jgi:beta-lactam-binding protein with PASTA domain